MTYDDVIEHFGTVANAATELGMSDKGIYKWKQKPIDPLRQCMIELHTDGALKTDPGCHSVSLPESA